MVANDSLAWPMIPWKFFHGYQLTDRVSFQSALLLASFCFIKDSVAILNSKYTETVAGNNKMMQL